MGRCLPEKIWMGRFCPLFFDIDMAFPTGEATMGGSKEFYHINLTRMLGKGLPRSE
jgi:hypothetical protein